MIRSYPSVFALGHRAVADLLLDPVLVQEKVDGSQISFGRYSTCGTSASVAHSHDEECMPEIRVRSKGAQLNVCAPDKMFAHAVAVIIAMGPSLGLNWTYRGEYLAKPKHNALAYDRIPRNFIALFDVEVGEQTFLTNESVILEALRIGVDVVPTLYQGVVDDLEMFRRLLDSPSFLGGQKVEGVVVKNYHRFGVDKKVLMGKFVSEAFKEVHAAEWKVSNPKQGDVLGALGRAYTTPARWAKSVQHLRESGDIEDSPRDIGLLIRAVGKDIEAECEAEIKEKLWEWAWPHLYRMSTRGLAEWYKDELLKRQFENLDVVLADANAQVESGS